LCLLWPPSDSDSENLWFWNCAIYQKSKTCIRSADDWPNKYMRQYAYLLPYFTGINARNLAPLFHLRGSCYKIILIYWSTDVLKLLYIWTTACQPTWTIHADTNVDYGQRHNASTVQDCQAACVSNIECTGFDYVSGASQGQRCWLSGRRWSGGRNNGNMPGVTHYDINRSCTGIFSCYSCQWRQSLGLVSPGRQLTDLCHPIFSWKNMTTSESDDLFSCRLFANLIFPRYLIQCTF